MNQFIKYIISGVLNTLVGYGVFWVAFRWLGCQPEVANAISYAVGLFIAYQLNCFFVFTASSVAVSLSTVARFILAFVIAFAANQFVLFICFRFFLISAELSQVLAMTSYTLIFYFLNKYYAFKVT